MNVSEITKPSKYSVHYVEKKDQSCGSCKKLIRKGNLFIVEIFNDKDQKISLRQNEMVYHSHCFARIRSQLNWNQAAEKLVGFDKLANKTQNRLKILFPDIDLAAQMSNFAQPQNNDNTKNLCTSRHLDPNDEQGNGSDLLYKSQQPLLNLEFAVIDGIRENRKKIEKTINDMGGSVTTRIHCNLAAVISNHQNIQKDSFPLKRAKECNVHVVSEEILLDAAQTSDPIQSLIIQRSLCDWESDPCIRISRSVAGPSNVENNLLEQATDKLKDSNCTMSDGIHSRLDREEQQLNSTCGKSPNSLNSYQTDLSNYGGTDSIQQEFTSITTFLGSALTQLDEIMHQMEELKFFCQHYQKVRQPDVDHASTKSLCSYLKDLNDVMIGMRSSLKKSNTDHTEVAVMRENVKNLQRFLKDGIDLMQAKRFYEAINVYTKALQIEPSNDSTTLTLLHGRAYAISNIGNFRKAIDECNKALAIDSSCMNVRLLRAQCYHYMGEFEASICDYEWAQAQTELKNEMRTLSEIRVSLANVKAEMNRKHAEAKNASGDEQFNLKNYPSAEQFYSEAHCPDNLAFYRERCDSMIYQGQIKRALEDCRQMIKADPNNEIGYQLQAKCHLICGDYDMAAQAIRHIRKFNRLENLITDLREFERLTIQNFNNKNFSSAEKGSNALPDSIHLRMLRAECLMHIGDVKRIRKLEKTNGLSEADKCFLKSLCFCCEGNLDMAILQLKQSLADDPNHTKSKSWLNKLERFNVKKSDGGAVLSKGRFHEAIRLYTEALQSVNFENEIVFDVLLSRAKSYAKICKFQHAINDYDKALKIKPTHVDAMLQLAECHEQSNNIERTIECYEAALNNDAIKKNVQQVKLIRSKIATILKCKDSHSQLKSSSGQADFAAKSYENALKKFNEAILLQPENDLYYEYRAECLTRMQKYRAAFKDYRFLLAKGCQLTKIDHYDMIKCCLIVGDVLYTEKAIAQMEKLKLKKNAQLNEYKKQLNKLKTLEESAMENLKKNNFKLAISQADLALEIASESLKLKLLKAECLALDGRCEEANSIAQSCKSIDPCNADAAYICALCVCKKNLDQGIQSLKYILNSDPDHEKAKSMLKRFKSFKDNEKLGNDLLQREQYRAAIDHFSDALTLPEIPAEFKENFHYLRALAYSKIGLNRDAIKDCFIAIRSVNRIKVLKLRAECYKNMRDFPNCVNDYEELYKLESTAEHQVLLKEAKIKLKRFESSDYYDVLDIEKGATQADIKKAYKNLSLIHHPDKHADASDAEKRKQEEIFKRIQNAFQVLSDPKEKAAYDRRYTNPSKNSTDDHQHSFNTNNNYRQSSNEDQNNSIFIIIIIILFVFTIALCSNNKN